jgi:hypothetical protein
MSEVRSMDFTIRKAGLAFALLVIIIFGGYYATLSSQDTFLRDNRWVSDRSALNLVLENEVNAIFTFESDEIREKLPKDYKTGDNITSIPLDNTEELMEQIERFKDAIPLEYVTQEDVDAYFNSVAALYVYDDLQYNAALSTVVLRLQIDHLQRLGPNIPPIVVSTETVERMFYVLSVTENGTWKAKMFIEDLEAGLEAPIEALVRYMDVEV